MCPYDPALDTYLERKAKVKEEIDHALRLAFGIGVLLGLLIFLVHGCGQGAHSDNGARAVEIQGPVNTVCFAIEDGAGKTVGGNCLWTR